MTDVLEIWFPTLLYICGYVFTFRRIAGQVAWHNCEAAKEKWSCIKQNEFPDSEQWFGGIAAGLVLSIVWPLSLAISYGLSTVSLGTGFFYCPKDQKNKLQRKRIAELEREAGIR